MRRRRNLEVIAGRVSAAGAIDAGEGFTVLKTGTAVYVVTFPSSFRLLAASGGRSDSNGFVSALLGYDPNGVRFCTMNVSGTTVDGAFSFVVVGYQQ